MDIPGTTDNGQILFNTNKPSGTFSTTERRLIVDGKDQGVPTDQSTLLQIDTTLTTGDVDTYRIQWMGATRTFQYSIANGDVILRQLSRSDYKKCQPTVKGGRCRTEYAVNCQCYFITEQRNIEAQTVINGPIKDIGFFVVDGIQAIYVRNEAGDLRVAFGLDSSFAANPKILSVFRTDERPDSCGDVPGYCPKYPTRYKVAGDSFVVNKNDYIYLQILGGNGVATLALS